MNYNKIPKIELHLHLDGSIRLSTAAKLLNLDISDLRSKMIAKDVKNLSEYLSKFDLPIELLQTKENLKLISKELASDLKDDGVVYAEIRFCPLFHTKKGLTPEQVIDSVLEGLKCVNIKTNLILCMMRNFNYEENKKIIMLAEKYLNNGVVAIDLAGDESKYKTSSFEDLFLLAQKKNIPYTIHSGEVEGFDSIKSALDFKTKRLGHGIKIIDEDELIKYATCNDIMLEVCPTSNVNTKVVKSYSEHPIRKLYDKNINISINTDNRTVSDITLSKEYELLNKYFQFNEDDFYKINRKALEFAFISDEEKEKIKELLK